MEASGGNSSSSASFYSQPGTTQKSRKRGDRKLKSNITTTGSKKERWLLTRKTWRYMTDAVGNLLPTTPGSVSAVDNTIKNSPIVTSDHPLSTVTTTTTSSSTNTNTDPSSSGSRAVASSFTSTSSSSNFKSTVGTQSTIVFHHQQDFNSGQDTKTITLGERQFQKSCNNQNQFLIWTRTRATRISGPGARHLKTQKSEEVTTSGGICPESCRPDSANVTGDKCLLFENVDCFSTTEGEEEVLLDDDEEMEGDEYDEYDDEQVTVREGRKSSLASSISSVISGLSFFRPATAASASESVGSATGEISRDKEKTFASIGVQTEPFPEETLNRLRRQCFLQENTSPDALAKFQSTTASSVGVGGGPDAYIHNLSGVPSESEFSTHYPQNSFTSFSTTSTSSQQTQQQQQVQQQQQQQQKTGQEIHDIVGSSAVVSIADSTEVGNVVDVGSTSRGTTSSVPSSVPSTGEPDKKSEESGYSSSISDTVMRYLRMVRKNSKVDKSDMDRFKTVNYDRSLRNIKSKNVSIEEALEHEKNKQLAGQKKAVGDSAAAEFSCAITSSNLEKLQEEYSNRMSSTAKDVTIPEKTTQRAAGGGGVGKLPKILPSVGIQAGESLVRFLKLFNRRKCSDFSSPSFCSSESPVDVTTSPRCSLATTIISSSGSDNDFFQHPRPSPRASFDTNSQSTFDEPPEFENDVFTSSGHYVGGGASYQYPPHQLFSPYQSPSSLYSYNNPTSMNLSHNQPTIGSSHSQQSSKKHPSPSHSSSFDHHSYQMSALANIPPSNLTQLQQQQQQQALGGMYNVSMNRALASSGSGSGGGDHQKNIPHASSSSSSTGLNRKRSSFPSQRRDSGQEMSVGTSATSGDWPMTSMTTAGGKTGQQQQQQHQSQPQPQQTFIKSLFSSGNKKNAGGGRSAGVGQSGSDSPGIGTVASGGIIGSDSRLTMSSTVGSASSSSNSSRSRLRDGRESVVVQKAEGGFMRQQSITGADINNENLVNVNANIPQSECIDSSFPSVMQKSKSSSSVLQQSSSSTSGYSSSGNRLISKAKLFKSKKQTPSTTRQEVFNFKAPVTTWTPQQGKPGKWTSLLNSRQVSLEPTRIHNLSEVERVALQKVALANLQALNLGVDVKIPREKTTMSGSKPKRRPYLLKKKALSTGFFDSKRDESSGKDGASGLVFAIALSQCVKNDQDKRQTLEGNTKALQSIPTEPLPTSPPWGDYQQQQQERRKSHHSSRLSVSSDNPTKEDKGLSGSNESLFWSEKKSGSFNQLYTGGSNNDISEEDSDVNYGQVPQLVLACVKHLETFGLHTTGIFRVSSSMKRIRQLREEIDSGKEIRFGEEHSPHDVAALLKEFLRDLPEPLLCRELYEAFLRTQRIRNRRLQLESIQHLIHLLPVANRDTLYALLSLFSKVVENCQDKRSKTGELVTGNKMEAYSLATLIAPNILPCMPMDGNLGSGEQQAILTKERRDSIDVVNYMITNYKELFFVSPETLHQVYMELLETNPEAVENILRGKFPAVAQGTEDVDTASSVFDGGSECGEEDIPSTKTHLRRREEILHEGGGKGGSGLSERSDSGRIKMEIGSQSGGDSDSSSTKSTSRWFRKSKSDQKNRASSDSGSDKVKGSRKKDIVVGGIEECRPQRASSLDSVNLKDISLGRGVGRLVESPQSSAKVTSSDRQRSSSDQGLKIPVDMSRRQSSPLLESRSSGLGSVATGVVGSGGSVIRASLKITMPLNIDDTDIPFIEEDNSEAHTYTAISPGDHGTSSPVDDLSSASFPYQEIQARICLGGLQVSSKEKESKAAITSSSHRGGSSPKTSASRLSSNLSSHENSPSSSTAEVAGTSSPQLSSSHLQINLTTQNINVSSPSSSSCSPGPSHCSSQNEPKGLGKETKGANISGLGLIKSKTADFEKLAKRSSSSSTSSSALTAPIRERTRKSTKEQHVGQGQGVSESVNVQGGNKGKQTSVTASPPSSQGTVAAAGGRWKRSEIIASPSAKKHETFL